MFINYPVEGKEHTQMEKRKKEAKELVTLQIKIKLTFNNTIITITNNQNIVLKTISTGHVGFKKARRGTNFAAKILAESVVAWLTEKKKINTAIYIIKFKGVGENKDVLAKTFVKSGLRVIKIIDTTPIAHNGCTKPKKRRN